MLLLLLPPFLLSYAPPLPLPLWNVRRFDDLTSAKDLQKQLLLIWSLIRLVMTFLNIFEDAPTP